MVHIMEQWQGGPKHGPGERDTDVLFEAYGYTDDLRRWQALGTMLRVGHHLQEEEEPTDGLYFRDDAINSSVSCRISGREEIGAW